MFGIKLIFMFQHHICQLANHVELLRSHMQSTFQPQKLINHFCAFIFVDALSVPDIKGFCCCLLFFLALEGQYKKIYLILILIIVI